MSFIAKLEPKEYELSPKGTYPIICCDLEKPPSIEYPKKDKKTGKILPGIDVVEQIRLLFLSGGPPMKDGRPFLIRHQRPFKLYPASAFRKDLESWKGEDLNEEDLARGFDLEQWAIGRVGMGTIEHNSVTKNGITKVYANIKTLTPLPLGMEAKAEELKGLLVGYVRMRDREGSEEAMRLAQERLQQQSQDSVPF